MPNAANSSLIRFLDWLQNEEADARTGSGLRQLFIKTNCFLLNDYWEYWRPSRTRLGNGFIRIVSYIAVRVWKYVFHLFEATTLSRHRYWNFLYNNADASLALGEPG